jgi:ribosome recycling factor
VPKDKIAELMKEIDHRMLESIDVTKREYAMVRTGRANPAVLDRVRVEYYGEKVPIKQVGAISIPEPRMLMVAPWDKSMVKPVVDAITSSNLGLNPNTDGTVIRIPLPQLTTERRQELARIVARTAEDGKVAIRNIRRDAVEMLRAMKKSGEISEDDLRRFQEQVQTITDAHTEQLSEAQETKEREIMEV